MCLTANPGWEWQYSGFFCSFAMLICVQYKNNRVGNLPWRGFWKKNRFFAHRKGGGNADSCELYWLIFWFHIVILCKISFYLIGHTIWFNTEIKFSFFEPPLLFCNGDSKNENLSSLQKYRVRPIKWKEILHRITIWNQKMSQYNSQESALPPPFLWVKNRFFFKNPSREDFQLDCSCIVHRWA